MTSCVKCAQVINQEDLIKCATCLNNHHYACVGLSDTDFKKILPMNKIKWKCPGCKQPKKPMSPIIINNSREGEPAAELPSIVNIDLEAFMKHIDSKFKALADEIKSMKSSINEKFTTFKEKQSSFETRINTLEATIGDLTTTNTKLSTNNETLQKQLSDLQGQLDEQDQRSRLCNIELQNVPFKKGENLNHLAQALGRLTNVEIKHGSIQSIHRVAHNMKSSRPKNIIIQLTTRRLRDELIAAARVRRGITAGQLLEATGTTNPGAGSDQTPIFVNEHLTLKNKILYSRARDAKKSSNFKFIWISNGTILLRKDDNTKIITIKKESDLAKIS